MQCLCQARNGSIERVDHGTAVLIDLWAGKMVSHLGDVIVDGVRATPGPVQQPRMNQT